MLSIKTWLGVLGDFRSFLAFSGLRYHEIEIQLAPIGKPSV